MLPCKHMLHRECIDMWLSRSKVCPMCKAVVQDAGSDLHVTVNAVEGLGSTSTAAPGALLAAAQSGSDADQPRSEPWRSNGGASSLTEADASESNSAVLSSDGGVWLSSIQPTDGAEASGRDAMSLPNTPETSEHGSAEMGTASESSTRAPLTAEPSAPVACQSGASADLSAAKPERGDVSLQDISDEEPALPSVQLNDRQPAQSSSQFSSEAALS